MAINLYTSNRLEILAAHCAAGIRHDPLPPLEPEIIVVQSRGMARWLAMELAASLSVWANGHFPFPNAFVNDIFSRLLPERSDALLYDRQRAAWQIMELLAEVADRPLFAPLREYVGEPLARFQLAGQLADLFDQYIVYRPEMIGAWEGGEEDGWQAELWRLLLDRRPLVHRATLLEELRERLGELADPSPLPRRVSLFAISSLPPFYLDILTALSDHLEINLYFVNPCRHWWADIVSAKDIARRSAAQGVDPEELYLETGNTLLASMGRMGRDFLALLQERECLEEEFFLDPDGDSLLDSLQDDILELRNREEAALPDDSLVINSCHSPMRELEVLQDHLLALFAGHDDLAPRDVIVMVPDIEPYSPLIEAVFGLDHDHPHHIPFSIADRKVTGANPVFSAFFALLDLAGGRETLRQIMDVLTLPPVRNRFALKEADCTLSEEWLTAVAVRWGRDGRFKERFGLPGQPDNTWRAGLDRLLMGYAAEAEELCLGILPFPAVEGSESEVLGRLLDAVKALFALLDRLGEKRTFWEWGNVLQTMLDDFLAVAPEEEDDLLTLRTTLQEMVDLEGELTGRERFGLEVVASHLTLTLQREKSPHGFLGSGVTFCSMLPMRAIPFQVICLLGMDDSSFPRPGFTLSFDLTRNSPRPGDRNLRDDDRYLFLETLLSARRQLYISYVGQSQKDDAVLPPSVLVSELLDYLHGEGGGQEETARAFVTRHRLQPFHPAYFRPGSGLVSYSRDNFQAARQGISGRPAGGFWQGLPLPAPEEETKRIDFADLRDFFQHPVRFFCRRRLGVFLGREEEAGDDNEPFAIDGLDRYHLAGELLAGSLAGKEAADPLELARARGLLPPGRVGDIAFAELSREVEELAFRVKPYLSPRLEPLEFELAIGDFFLWGRLDELRRGDMLFVRPARVKGRDLLQAWLCQLVLQEVSPGLIKRIVVAGKDRTVFLSPCREAGRLLAELVAFYRQGLTAPLDFAPETSMAYAGLLRQGKIEQAGREAMRIWQGGYQLPGEGDDVYHRFRFRGDEPLPRQGGFEGLALTIFTPLFEHAEEIAHG